MTVANLGGRDVDDIGSMISEWGGSGRADLNGDSIVDVNDLIRLLGVWGEC